MVNVLDRLKEPSTWRGIIAILTVVGVNLSPDTTNAIVSAGVSVVSVIEMVTKDK